MQALTDRIGHYEATRVMARPRSGGLWSALSNVVCDASVLPPDPVSDARVEEIVADEARRALLSHLATL
jgi:hypothetical protein